MTYTLFITGCQQNIYDSKKITHLLNKMGYFESEEKDADVIIVLSCSVRQKPMDRIFGKFRIWNKLPKKPKIVITGCVLPSDRKKIQPKVNAIISIKEIEKELPKIIGNHQTKKRDSVNTHCKQTNKLDDSFVPIMYGCDNFCSYCAVPYTRGREVSRPDKEIIEEIKNKVKSGLSEITLLGQNVNSFKLTNKHDSKITKGQDFVKLLEKIEEINGLEKISFLTSHPKDMSDELIDWMAKSKKFSRELHLPVQSGDNEILRKMNRNYTVEKYTKLIENCKLKIVNLYLSTDIIVGFPGETRKQFENTFALAKKIKFDMAYVSQYSPRPDTAASKMKDDVSKSEKKRRWLVLDKFINKKRQAG